MGAWGTDTFENDDACDFAADIQDGNGLFKVEQALDAVLETTGYLEAPVASAGLAAADIVARLRGHFGQQDTYTERIDTWVRSKNLSLVEPSAAKAVAVIDRVRTEPSELLELWTEDDPTEWFAALDGLKERLAKPPSTSSQSESATPERKGFFSRLFRN